MSKNLEYSKGNLFWLQYNPLNHWISSRAKLPTIEGKIQKKSQDLSDETP